MIILYYINIICCYVLQRRTIISGGLANIAKNNTSENQFSNDGVIRLPGQDIYPVIQQIVRIIEKNHVKY